MFLPCATACASYDRHAAGAAALGELEAEAALAGARLGDDADHLPVPALRAAPAPPRASRISASRPTKRERPRARETSKRVRSGADALAARRRAPARATPLTWNAPEIVAARSSRRPAPPCARVR